ncbi:MAG: glycine--tRNA ligase subunit beta, partial [Actinomycetota bacterium]|nr:glycine--tRNA ligase subunit beta [Actinomycetota bacterium]
MSRDLVFEIGAEEIPSAALYDAIAQLKRDAETALKTARLGYSELHTYGSPRRIVLVVEGLAEAQDDLSQSVKGPPVAAAFDASGNPTPAAVGFARGKGVDVSALESRTDADGAYVYAVIERAGEPALAVLPELLASLLTGLAWPKVQRWGSGSARFIRPVRSLLALLGAEVVPVEFAEVSAGRTLHGHRFLGEGAVEVPSADQYAEAARRGCVVYDHGERARLVREGIAATTEQRGVTAVVPDKTLAE